MGSETVVTFGLGDALFALPVAPVMEIREAERIAPLPRAPAHLLGLIDRRGFNVPVVDLRTMLGEPVREDTFETRIVVLRVGGTPPNLSVVGLKVDRVIEVAELDADGAVPLAEADLLRWNERIVAGVGRRDGAFVTLLRVDALFGNDVLNLAPMEAMPT